VNKVIIKAECLKEVISEIDTSNELIEIIISIEKKFLRISSYGIIGDTHVTNLYYSCI
jgi:cell cycle checkpoint protein